MLPLLVVVPDFAATRAILVVPPCSVTDVLIAGSESKVKDNSDRAIDMPLNPYFTFSPHISVRAIFSLPHYERREKALLDKKIPELCTLLSLCCKSWEKSGTWNDGKKIPLFAKRKTT